jgi:hypothetical protein
VTVELPVGAAQLSTVDDSGRPRLEPGVVEVQTGLSAADLAGVRLTLTGPGTCADGVGDPALK